MPKVMINFSVCAGNHHYLILYCSISYLSLVPLPLVLISGLLILFGWLSSLAVPLPWSCCPPNHIVSHLQCFPLCISEMDVAPHAQRAPEALLQACMILFLSREGNQTQVGTANGPVRLECNLLWSIEDRKCIH